MTHSGPVVPGRTRPPLVPGSSPGSIPGPGAAIAPRPDQGPFRLGSFINLPFASLDKLTLRKRLDEIGEDKPDESA